MHHRALVRVIYTVTNNSTQVGRKRNYSSRHGKIPKERFIRTDDTVNKRRLASLADNSTIDEEGYWYQNFNVLSMTKKRRTAYRGVGQQMVFLYDRGKRSKDASWEIIESQKNLGFERFVILYKELSSWFFPFSPHLRSNDLYSYQYCKSRGSLKPARQ